VLGSLWRRVRILLDKHVDHMGLCRPQSGLSLESSGVFNQGALVAAIHVLVHLLNDFKLPSFFSTSSQYMDCWAI
jgi:hypothetical protein